MRNRKLKIKYRCRNCGTLNQTGWKNWTINSKPTICRNCRTLNYFIRKKILYFDYIAFIPSKYYKVYRKFIKKQKEYKKKLFEQTTDIKIKQKVGRQEGYKLRAAFERICYLTNQKQPASIKNLES
ncbi:MAG: hypothetical protein U9Q21_02885 [Candidatus Auribacterota bacterium]|nr:hypothetical protein [Candidatus Auribacterota bacterium]